MARRGTVRAVQDRPEFRGQGLVADPGVLPFRERGGTRRSARAGRGAGAGRPRGGSGGIRATSRHRGEPGRRGAACRSHDRQAGIEPADPGAGADGPAVHRRGLERTGPGHRPARHDEGPRREHGRVPQRPHRDKRAHGSGQAHDRQPDRGQQPHGPHARRQGELHAPHRVGDHPDAQGVPEPERLLRRGRRQALGGRAGAHQSRHRDRPAQARRHARADGPQHQTRRHPDVRRVPRLVRGPHLPHSRRQAHRSGLPGHDDLAHQPGWHRHGSLRPAPHEGPGLHRRRRRARISRRVPGLEREDPRRAGHRQDDHPHEHVRPPRHPGRRLGRVPQEGA